MKNRYLMYIITFIFIITLYPSYSFAENDDTKLLNSFEKDITGDGFEEYIKLKGDLMNTDSGFYQNVWITIQDSFQKEWSISLQHGYQPEISFINLTKKNYPDIFYKIAKDERLENFHYQIYHVKQNKFQAIELPKLPYKNVVFKNNYQLAVHISPTQQPLTLDITSLQNRLLNSKIYDTNGNVIDKQMPIIDNNSSISPVVISHSKGYGLKTENKIVTHDNSLILGSLETVWYYKKDKWLNIKTTLKTAPK